jgi:hypothetical protein
MSQTFSCDLSVADAPAIAQARLRTVVTESVLKSTKMRLSTEVNGSLAYRPPINFPLVVALSRRISGENVKVGFTQARDGGTKIEVSGKVAGNSTAIAGREFWTEALTAS